MYVAMDRLRALTASEVKTKSPATARAGLMCLETAYVLKQQDS